MRIAVLAPSPTIIQDDVFARLLTFPNVLIPAHQAFFTEDALSAIAETTLANIGAFEDGHQSGNGGHRPDSRPQLTMACCYRPTAGKQGLGASYTPDRRHHAGELYHGFVYSQTPQALPQPVPAGVR